MNYYISDTHFGHISALNFDGRPWNTIEEETEGMIERWNSVVTPQDTVWILGDFCYKTTSEKAREIGLCLNGHKHLILGNHDQKNAEWYKDVFEEWVPYKEIQDVVHEDGSPRNHHRNVVMSHYFIPFYHRARQLGFMLHGHTHASPESDLEEQIKEQIRNTGKRCEAYNVGCMWQHYYPQTLDQIIARQPRDVQIV